MERSRGSMTANRLFSVKDLGLGNPEPHVDRVIKKFLAIGEAVAARWIEMPTKTLPSFSLNTTCFATRSGRSSWMAAAVPFNW